MLITLVLAFAASTTSSRSLPAWLAIRHVSGVQDGNGKFRGIPVIKLPSRKCPLLGKADIIRQPLPVVFELYLEIMISIYFRVGCTK